MREPDPHCPAGRETIIAEHACLKHSGRVGRLAAAKDMADEVIDLAVIAHIRHVETPYDRLLGRNWMRRCPGGSRRCRAVRCAAKWG